MSFFIEYYLVLGIFGCIINSDINLDQFSLELPEAPREMRSYLRSTFVASIVNKVIRGKLVKQRYSSII